MKKARFIAGALLLVPSFLFAQAQGRIKGTVLDTKGKPVKGAKIIMTCPDISNFHREVLADDKGNWATLVVDATKTYMFHCEAQGYRPMEQMAKPLIASQTLELPFTLTSIAELQAQAQEKALEEPGIKQLREAHELREAADEADTAAKAARASGDKAAETLKKDEAAKDLGDARAKFAEAVAAKPDLYLAWLGMGDIDQKAGRNDDALTAAEKCLASKPNFPQCLALGMNAAQAKKDKTLYEKYAAAYKTANPDDPVVYFNEAVAFLNKGDDAKAKPLLEKALEADPKYADAMFQLGMVCFRTGDTAKAKELLQKFLDAAPNHKEAPTAKEMLKYM